MAVTKAPSIEAAEVIVARIETGADYSLPNAVRYAEVFDDKNDGELRTLLVDVVPETEEQLTETLDIEDRTSHVIRVFIRRRVDKMDSDEVSALKLIVRQIWQRLNNYKTDEVTIWSVSLESAEVPRKSELRQGIFTTSLLVRCEVEAS
jgi:DNA-directed RNA polymerase subunit F